MQEHVTEKSRCSKCGSTQVYLRFITREKVCRTCGHIEKNKEKEW